jgi:NAD(P)-dependent dehydrogenase (short-subunit alcohol dehydrogenase family)
LNGKTIIVTGAAGGLGSVLSMEAARDGFNTVMVDSDQRGLEEAYDRITDSDFPEPALHPMDLSSAGPENFEELLDRVNSEFGGLDMVVHCAARFEGLTPLEQVSPAEWLMQIQVNLNAAWLLSAQCLPLLRNSESGHLYFLLEDLPKVRGAFWGAYGVSKHALRALVSQFAAECKSSRIQVLGINPGPLRSALRSRAYHAENPASQPNPCLAAEQIMQLLKGDIEPDDNFVDLQRG